MKTAHPFEYIIYLIPIRIVVIIAIHVAFENGFRKENNWLPSCFFFFIAMIRSSNSIGMEKSTISRRYGNIEISPIAMSLKLSETPLTKIN